VLSVAMASRSRPSGTDFPSTGGGLPYHLADPGRNSPPERLLRLRRWILGDRPLEFENVRSIDSLIDQKALEGVRITGLYHLRVLHCRWTANGHVLCTAHDVRVEDLRDALVGDWFRPRRHFTCGRSYALDFQRKLEGLVSNRVEYADHSVPWNLHVGLE